MTSWTEDNNITTPWKEDTLRTEWSRFHHIDDVFDTIDLKFSEMGEPFITFSEDDYVSTTISEDTSTPPTWAEDTSTPPTWSED